MKNAAERTIMSTYTTRSDLGNEILKKSAGTLRSMRFINILESYLQDITSILAFSKTCQTAQYISYDFIKNRLLTAVVHGNEHLVREIVILFPELLLKSYTTKIVTEIVKDLSGKEIKNLTPLQAAICAGDVDLVKMIKEVLYQELRSGVELGFDPDLEIRRQLTAIYKTVDIDSVVKAQKAKAQEFKTSTLHDLFTKINAATNEQVKFELHNPGMQDPDSQLNTTLRDFRQQFTITSNQELIFNPFYLLAAFEAFEHCREQFPNFNGLANAPDNRLDLYWRQVIGYIQRHLPACYLQAFAQGIRPVVAGGKLKRDFEFSDLFKGIYMRPAPLNINQSTLGYNYAAGEALAGNGVYTWMGMGLAHIVFKKYCEQKNQVWRDYSRNKRSRCNIS